VKCLALCIALAVLAVSAPSASAVTYETAPSFCDAGVLRDYLAPTRELPKLRGPSRTGLAGIGRSNLLLKTAPRLAVGKDRIEYWFTLGNSKRPVRPGWTVIATLSRVDADGRAVERIGRSKRRLGTVKATNFPGGSFTVGGEPAMYRLLLDIRGAQGQEIARYGSYHRAEPLLYDTRLGLNAASYRPEQTVFAKVENLGTGSVSFGAEYRIQRREGSRWVRAPESPRRFIKPLYRLGAGVAGRCHEFWIPPTMPPGRYRMTKGISLADEPAPGVESAFLTAEFDIVP
jgi:hypothetical protein